MIRPATPADLPGLRTAIRAAYAPFVTAGLQLPPVDQGLEDDLRDNIIWVAGAADRILGGFVLVLTGETAHLANLAVHPDAAGQGLGRRLVAQASALAQEAGYPSLHLTTHREMADTRAFYAALGWQETGEDGNKVFLSKPLIERNNS